MDSCSIEVLQLGPRGVILCSNPNRKAGLAMADMRKSISRWTGFAGSPGFTVLYFDAAATTIGSDVRAFWDAIKGLLPTTVTINVDAGGDVIDDATGNLTGTWPGTAPLPVTGTHVGTYAAPAGAMVTWNSQGIVHNRRVRGKTFLVPSGSGVYASDGSLDATDIATLQAAADALIASASSQLLVWSRPFAGAPNNPARVGSSHVVSTATIKDKAVVLTSRRD